MNVYGNDQQNKRAYLPLISLNGCGKHSMRRCSSLIVCGKIKKKVRFQSVCGEIKTKKKKMCDSEVSMVKSKKNLSKLKFWMNCGKHPKSKKNHMLQLILTDLQRIYTYCAARGDLLDGC